MVFIEPEHTDTVKKWYNYNKFSCFPLYNMSGCRLLISIRMNEISLHEAPLHLRKGKLIKIIRDNIGVQVVRMKYHYHRHCYICARENSLYHSFTGEVCRWYKILGHKL